MLAPYGVRAEVSYVRGVPPVVNAAWWRIVQVAGASKAAAVAGWMAGDPALPITRVRRSSTLAVLDAAAAAQL